MTIAAPQTKPDLLPKEYPPYAPRSFSHSQNDSYQRCPYWYYLNKVAKVKEPPNHYAVFGSMIHEIVEEDGIARIKKKKRLTFKSLVSKYKYRYSKTNFPWPNKQTQEKYYDLGLKMMEYYAMQRPRHLHAVELRFSLKDILPIPITGIIDVVSKDGDNYSLMDYKTGNPYKKKVMETNQQLTLYSLAIEKTYGVWPVNAEYYFLKTGDIIAEQKTPEQAETMIEDYKESLKGIYAGDFNRSCEDSWWCNNICGYGMKNICPKKA